MMSSNKIEGIIRNAFYTTNQRKENIDTYLDRERRKSSEKYIYDVNEKDELIIIEIN